MKHFLSVVAWPVRLMLAAFFAFVGYWKAVGPIAALAKHHAWVAFMPDWLARAVGWQEIICALMLLVPMFSSTRLVAFWGALLLLLNQIAALGVHAWRNEAAEAGSQNLVLCALLFFVLYATRGKEITLAQTRHIYG